MTIDRFDVAVVGGGLVGLAVALAVQRCGLRTALVARRPSQPDSGGTDWDSRVYAISPGSAVFLDELGAWPAASAERITPVEFMRIHGDDDRARLEFSAYDAGLQQLAFIVESRLLQGALWRCLDAAPVARFDAGSCLSLLVAPEEARLTLADGGQLAARLVVGADGADSWVRDQAGIVAAAVDYGQQAVVANFACERPHRGTACQWFRRDGVLALLPLAGCRVSMVWSVATERAQHLLELDAGWLAEEATAASREAHGALSVITAPAAFPLRLQRIAQFACPRVALAGDAAHNVHPLAGQGVNLGFRDARALAEALASRAGRHDCGEHALLRRYERARREDVAAMELMTHGLQKLFGFDAAWVARARNLGLRLVNLQPHLKKLLIQRAVA